MERSKLVWSASGVAMALLLSVGAAHAANDKYTTTLNAVRGRNPGQHRLKTKLKVNLAASTTDASSSPSGGWEALNRSAGPRSRAHSLTRMDARFWESHRNPVASCRA